jgi:hypothetical protein
MFNWQRSTFFFYKDMLMMEFRNSKKAGVKIKENYLYSFWFAFAIWEKHLQIAWYISDKLDSIIMERFKSHIF